MKAGMSWTLATSEKKELQRTATDNVQRFVSRGPALMGTRVGSIGP